MNKIGYRIVKSSTLNEISNYEKSFRLFKFLKVLGYSNIKNIIDYFENYNSQLGQDLFVLNYYDFKKNGYFIEFGATNGKSLSNSYVLEKNFGWEGILSEPAKKWHDELFINRQCNISKKCVWRTSGESIKFSEVNEGELSTISEYKKSDKHNRSNSKEYMVDTISLIELLVEFDAPRYIDYLSIDTEGSEYDILSNFDYDKYQIGIITVEHNYTKQRERIFNLLTEKGYERVLTELSQFDDWYVLKK